MMKFTAKGRTLNVPEEDFVVIDAICQLVQQKATEQSNAKIDKLYAALYDMAKYISRGDWRSLNPETRAALGEKE